MGRKRNNGLSEEKRNIIGQLIEMYDIKTAADIQEALKDLLGGTIQSMLETELEEQVEDREGADPEYHDSRNGYKPKRLRSSIGEIPIQVPQDRNSDFEPQVVPKYKKDITCSFFLFFHSMELDRNLIRRNAPLTFLNILLLSLFCCGVEWLLRRFTVDKPIQRIHEATRRMAKGDLSVRIDTSDLPSYNVDFIGIAEDFNLMAKELSSTETLRTDFVSNVSHELKTPLAVMRNYAALLKQPGLTEDERREYAAGIDGAVARMSTLITNILKLNKLENQQITTQPETFDLSEQVTECLLGFEDLWEKKNLEVDADIDEGVQVHADPEMLTLVWNNLISNAIKFTEPGGMVGVSVKAEGEWAVVSVTDTCCGMSAETLKHIFDKFYQGDTSHATEGNGLGLALVKRVVYLMGGELDVESSLGEGSTFTVKVRRNGHGE